MKRIRRSIEKTLFGNEFFKKILHTSRYLQIASLRLKPGAEIKLESHDSMDQFFGFKGGRGKCTVEGHDYIVENGDVIIIPAGSRDEVIKFDCHKKGNVTNVFNIDQKTASKEKAKSAVKRIS